MNKAKPFLKWVGGKGQLIEQLEKLLPANFYKWDNATYIEPFVGGGAMLFYMLQTYKNITSAVINDINPDLMTCYNVIKKNPKELIKSLENIQAEYYALSTEEKRKEFYLNIRSIFNKKSLDDINNTTLFIFLNRTCFNGLYRVNKSGSFNVPFGKYKNPTICDNETILADSELLQKVDIITGDFEETYQFAKKNTLFYFDPPYRPLSNTSSFNDYTKEGFNDDSQIRLKLFCDRINNSGYSFMLSNSDCSSKNKTDIFFEKLYNEYHIKRVFASRNINANPEKRGKITEILIRNFKKSFTKNIRYNDTQQHINTNL